MKTINKSNANLKTNFKRVATLVIILLGFNQMNAQIEKLAGPRVGMTFITPGSGADFVNEGLAFDANENKYGSTGAAFTTQFGWQWESRFGNGNGGFVGLVEWVALVGGLEKGRFLPSFSAIVGARTSKGFEFGVGPNLTLGGLGLVIGVGKNFKFGNLNVPVNLAFIPGIRKQGEILRMNSNYGTTYAEKYHYNTGSRISLMFGFNMVKSKPNHRRIN